MLITQETTSSSPNIRKAMERKTIRPNGSMFNMPQENPQEGPVVFDPSSTMALANGLSKGMAARMNSEDVERALTWIGQYVTKCKIDLYHIEGSDMDIIVPTDEAARAVKIFMNKQN